MRPLHFIDTLKLFVCCLCGDHMTGTGCICHPCGLDLPWIETACSRCGIPLPANGICGHCLRHTASINTVISAFAYHYPVAQLIRQGKYHGEIRIINSLALGLAQKITETVETMPEIMIPVPLHRGRLFSRGFNQAVEICRQLSAALGLPYDAGLVYRHRATRPMFELGPRARRDNIAGSFGLHETPVYHSVAIVDDVITSSATVDALANVLYDHGIKHVQVWSLARTF